MDYKVLRRINIVLDVEHFYHKFKEKILDSEIFSEVLKEWQNSEGKTPLWNKLAKKFGFSSGEMLRSQFRRERKKQGLPKRDKKEFQAQIKNAPKILVFDLETSPIIAYVWGLWNQNIQHDRIIDGWFLLSWSAKWLFSDEVFSDTLKSKEVLERNDERIVKTLWEIMDQADIIVAHNAKGFDIPRAQSRFLFHRLQPPSFSKVIDTLEIAKKNFDFSSNSLNYICGYLNLELKKETNFELWRKCMEGNSEALNEMRDYNRQDVNTLESMYVEVRPFIRPHPNWGLYGEGNGHICPNCGSNDLKENGFYYTQVSKFQSFRCNSCGALSRAKKNLLSKEEKDNLLQ